MAQPIPYNDYTASNIKSYVDQQIDLLEGGIGAANPTTTPDSNINSYFATVAGTYTNFGGIVVSPSDLTTGFVLLQKVNGTWTKNITSFATNFTVGKNKFDNSSMIVTGKYVDPVNGSIQTNVSRSMTTPISVTPSTTYTVSGYGNIHFGVGIRFTTSLNVFISFTTSAQDVTSFSFTTPSTAAFVEFTLITGKASENTVTSNIQLETGSIATSFQSYRKYVSSINGNLITALEVLPPTLGLSPINKDYADLTYLKDPVLIPSGKNVFDKNKVIPGFFIDGNNGSINTNGAYTVSNIIDILPGTYTLSGLGNIHFGLGFRSLNDSNTLVNFGFAAGQNLTQGTFTVASGATKVQFTAKTGASGDNINFNNVQLEYGPLATTYEQVEYAINTIAGNKLIAQRVPTVPTVQNSPISLYYFQQNAVFNPQYQIIGRNLFDKTKVIVGQYIDVTTGVIGTATNYSLSNVIPVQGGVSYTWSGLGSIHFGLGVRFTDSSGTYISVSTIPQNALSGTLLIPSNAAFIQFTIKTGASGDNTDLNTVQVERGVNVNPYKSAQQALIKVNSAIPLMATAVPPGLVEKDSPVAKGDLDDRLPFADTKGLKMFTFGDSITRNDSITNWPNYAVPLLGVTLSNFAVSGASFTDWAYTESERQRMSKQVTDAIATGVTPDIIVVAMGTNDFQRQNLLGDYDTAMGKSIASLDRTLIIEAMRWNFYTLTNQYPNCKFFCALPLQRALYTYGQMSWLLDAISKMAKSYDFIVFDAAAECGIIKDFETVGSPGRYLQDGLHPMENGKILQGKYMTRKIKSNF